MSVVRLYDENHEIIYYAASITVKELSLLFPGCDPHHLLDETRHKILQVTNSYILRNNHTYRVSYPNQKTGNPHIHPTVTERGGCAVQCLKHLPNVVCIYVITDGVNMRLGYSNGKLRQTAKRALYRNLGFVPRRVLWFVTENVHDALALKDPLVALDPACISELADAMLDLSLEENEMTDMSVATTAATSTKRRIVSPYKES